MVTVSVNLSNSLLTRVYYSLGYCASQNVFTSSQITTITNSWFNVNNTLSNYSFTCSIPSNAINGLVLTFYTLAQTSGTCNINNVQLETGSLATTFGLRPYDVEMAMCKQYYGNTNVNGNLNVTGMQNLYGNLSITGGNYQITGDSSLYGALNITGSKNLYGDSNLNGNLNITGTKNLYGDSNLNGNLNITGAKNLYGTLNISGTMNLTGSASISSTLSVSNPRVTVIFEYMNQSGLNVTASANVWFKRLTTLIANISVGVYPSTSLFANTSYFTWSNGALTFPPGIYNIFAQSQMYGNTLSGCQLVLADSLGPGNASGTIYSVGYNNYLNSNGVAGLACIDTVLNVTTSTTMYLWQYIPGAGNITIGYIPSTPIAAMNYSTIGDAGLMGAISNAARAKIAYIKITQLN